jgi:hypothetical protein
MVNNSITVDNGDNEKAQKIASITGMHCDKHGNELGTSEFSDVTHLPNEKFNLFSITKMQMNGWWTTLHGDSKKIWLTKGEHEVIFDIIIPTNKGLLFAFYFWRKTEISGAMTDGVKPTK